LPPFINCADNEFYLARYQTVCAREAGAVAAPTAGLHFDLAMMNKIKAKGVQTAFVTPHIGSGTFQPVRVENLSEHLMHKEYFAVPQTTVDTVRQARGRGGRVIAIGTTVVRALESVSKSCQLESGFGDTDLFITPSYQFKSVDAMLTIFIFLSPPVDAGFCLCGFYEPIMNAYSHNMDQSYRFFSYGDAMFLSR
jgi:S-adenosylmethionine:tRNA ribosyltransferase-isomerase